MRWIAVFFLPVFGIAGLMVADANEPSLPPVQVPTRIAPETNRDTHLHKAAEHLRAAGLNSLADHIRGLAQDSSPSKSDNKPNSTKIPKQVLLHIKVLAVDKEKLQQLGFDFSQIDFSQIQVVGGSSKVNKSSSSVDILHALQHDGLLKALRQDGLIRVVAEPTLVTFIGRPAQVRSRGEVMISRPGPDGKLVKIPKFVGTSVNVDPQLTGNGRLRLGIQLDVSDVVKTKSTKIAGRKIPAIRQKRMETGIEMDWGQTVVLSGIEQQSHVHADGKTDKATTEEVSTVVLITAEPVDAVALQQPSPIQKVLKKQ